MNVHLCFQAVITALVVLAYTGHCDPVRANETNGPVLVNDTNILEYFRQHVELKAGCTNRVLRGVTNLTITIGINNRSTNEVILSDPVCDIRQYEGVIKGPGGRVVDIGKKQKQKDGQPVAIFRNMLKGIDAGTCFACKLDLVLDQPMNTGKYTIILKRWCMVVMHRDEVRQVDAYARLQLVSAPIEFVID